MALVPLCIALIAASHAVVGFYLPGLAPVTYCESNQENCKVELEGLKMLFYFTVYCSYFPCLLFVFPFSLLTVTTSGLTKSLTGLQTTVVQCKLHVFFSMIE